MKKLLEDLGSRIECGPCLAATNKAKHVVFCPLHRAAPELLAALKAYDRWQSSKTPSEIDFARACRLARAAIAKAEGREA